MKRLYIFIGAIVIGCGTSLSKTDTMGQEITQEPVFSVPDENLPIPDASAEEVFVCVTDTGNQNKSNQINGRSF